jgi:hypothetical protein
MSRTAERFDAFRRLHDQDKPLLLPNAWDFASAAALSGVRSANTSRRQDRPRLMASALPLPDLHEAGGAEITIEGERLPDPAAPHDREARRVHEGVLALVVPAEPAPCIGLHGGVDVHHLDSRQFAETVQESDCRSVAGPATEQCPGLTDHVVGGAHPPDTGVHESPGLVVMAVAPLLESEPEARVRESHAFGP